jgi:16S rRNA (cytidine1402-2'-O)-methyltransferase
MANFFVVATPIGNLSDISFRALKVLKEADLILAEDTRQTKKLLNHFGISTPVISYHQHSNLKRINSILKLLKEGKNLVLVTDSGTPGISDPGGRLVAKVVESFGKKIKTIPIPGPSALTTAASVAGVSMDKFLFLGFPPAKRKRKKFFEKVVSSEYPVIFYESPHRLLKTLKELAERNQELKVVICKELTKKFEKIYRGKIKKVIKEIQQDSIKGEYVIVLKQA